MSESLEARIKALEDRVYIHLRVPFPGIVAAPEVKEVLRACGAKHGYYKEHKGEFDCPICICIYNKHAAEIERAWHKYLRSLRGGY